MPVPPLLEPTFQLDDCDDADLHVRLSIQSEDGSIAQFTEGRLRLSHNAIDVKRSTRLSGGELDGIIHVHRDTTPIAPDETIRTTIELLPTGFELQTGQRLILGLTAIRTDGDSAPGRLTLAAGSALRRDVLAHLATGTFVAKAESVRQWPSS